MRVIDERGLVWDESPYLAHHGILGQRWGKLNGPPYPLSASDHSASEKKAGWRKSLDKDGNTQTKKSAKIYTKQINKLEKQKAKASYEVLKESKRYQVLNDKASKSAQTQEMMSDISESYDDLLETIKKRTGSSNVQIDNDVQYQYLKEKLKEYKKLGYNTKTLEKLSDSTHSLLSKVNTAADIEKRGKELIHEAIGKGYSIESKQVAYRIDAGKDIVKWMFFMGIGSTNTYVVGDKYKVKKTKDGEYQVVKKDGNSAIIKERLGEQHKDTGKINTDNFDGYSVKYDDDGNILSVKDKNGKKSSMDKMFDDFNKQEERVKSQSANMSSRAKSMRSSGMSYAQIAKKLGIPESSVGYYLNL